MIQRQQSIYLFLIVLIGFVFTFSDITLYSGKAKQSGQEINYSISLLHSQIEPSNTTDGTHFSIAVSIVLLSLFSLVYIFMYGQLKRQLTFVTANFGLIAIVLINVYLIKGRIGEKNNLTYQELDLNWPIFVLLGLLILNFLAYRGIKKDLDLLASADRLR